MFIFPNSPRWINLSDMISFSSLFSWKKFPACYNRYNFIIFKLLIFI
ncbi:hypothetical protein A677_03469 [Salmonella enterica subsp. enterica serovar Enteritidis str. 2010K-0267]|nr:hypothetical protein A677_03469 [Salmonella enterica subsp. enterica serovar Enteritidis str. 2010K-0267]